MHTFKNTFIAFLIVTVMAPGFYFGIAPPPKAEAQNIGFGDIVGTLVSVGISATACAFGNLFANAVDWALDQVMEFVSNIAEGLFGDILGSITDFLGIGNFMGIQATVPVTVARLEGKAEKAADATVSLEFKECVLDSIIWVAKRILIEIITNSILEWIKTGFDGGPVFIRDPAQYAQTLINGAITVFLDESGVAEEICAPYRDTIINTARTIALQPKFGGGGGASCSFDTIEGGEATYLEMVDEGSIETGGIPAMMELTKEGNNQYEALLAVQQELAVRTGTILASEGTIANWGDGYHSMRCGTVADNNFGICTPGQFLAKQIDDWVGGALGQLEGADEVSEIIAEVFAYFVDEVFHDTEFGLLGESPEPVYPTPTGVAVPSEPGDTVTGGGGGGGGGDPGPSGGGGDPGGGGGGGTPGAFNVTVTSSGSTHGLVFSDIYITSGGTRISGVARSTHGSKLVAGAYGNFTTEFSADFSGSGTLHLILDSREGNANGERPYIHVSGSASASFDVVGAGYSKAGNRDIQIGF